jgi:hypothetical protein
MIVANRRRAQLSATPMASINTISSTGRRRGRLSRSKKLKAASRTVRQFHRTLQKGISKPTLNRKPLKIQYEKWHRSLCSNYMSQNLHTSQTCALKVLEIPAAQRVYDPHPACLFGKDISTQTVIELMNSTKLMESWCTLEVWLLSQ